MEIEISWFPVITTTGTSDPSLRSSLIRDSPSITGMFMSERIKPMSAFCRYSSRAAWPFSAEMTSYFSDARRISDKNSLIRKSSSTTRILIISAKPFRLLDRYRDVKQRLDRIKQVRLIKTSLHNIGVCACLDTFAKGSFDQ